MLKTLCLLFILLIQGSVWGQIKNEKQKEDKLNVFIDCSRCDVNYIREQISFVNYVRDRNESDVHILVNNIRTGGGGRKFTITFIGKNNFLSKNDTILYNMNGSESDDNNRLVLVRNLKLGLIPYISDLKIAENIEINYKLTETNNEKLLDEEWNYWVFRTRIRGWVNGEKSTNSLNLWGSFSANRITDDLKVKLSINGDYNEDNYDYEDETYTSISRQQSIRSALIFSYNDNWSYGFFGNIKSSKYDNIRLANSVLSGVEYNFFPYSEATRKQLRVSYLLSLDYNIYDEETVYFKTDEFLVRERIAISLDLIQPWGNIETELMVSHYMHDLSLHFLELWTEFEINVTTGLTIELFGRLAYIHDQIALPKTGVNLEEVLLRQKQLETNYEYWARFGFTYSFGSIYNNVVNTRFGN